MPIEHALWKVGAEPKPLAAAELDSEFDLEEMIAQDMGILSDEWLLVGRQVFTDFGKKIDLLAVDVSGSIIIIELKKHKTPREVVAQAIDYASWVKELDAGEIAEIYNKYGESHRAESRSLDQAFQDKYQTKLDESD